VLEGTVPQDKSENLKKFNAVLKSEILNDITPQTAVNEIECTIGAGTPYKEI
jgi:hypothetical protein